MIHCKLELQKNLIGGTFMSIFSLFKSRSKTKHKSIVIESKYGIFTSHKFGKNGVVFDGKINWLDDIVDVSLHTNSTESLMADKSLEILCKIAENATEWDKKLRQYGADEFSDDNGMIEIWGNDENNNDSLPQTITKDEFISRISLGFMWIYPDGKVYFDYNLDEMFTDHGLGITANISGEIISCGLQG